MNFSYGNDYMSGKNYSYYVRAVRGGQAEPFDSSVISVSPVSRNVAKDAGATTFSVSNTGTGTMPWTAEVTPASGWLRIISGASGTNSGTINCGFDANTSTSDRTATIWVTATTDATGSPVDVTVTQAPAPNPIGSNSINAMNVVKITDMSGLLPDGGRAVTISAWDKDGIAAHSVRVCLARIHLQSRNDQYCG